MNKMKSGLAIPRAGTGLREIGLPMLMLLLSACGTTAPWGIDLGDYEAAPRDLIGVASVGDDHVVRFGRAGYIGRLERGRLDAFVVEVAANHPESLHVALRGPATPARLNAVSNTLVADGVDPKNIAIADRRFGPPAPPGTVVVVVERAIAVEPHCPGQVAHISAPEDNQTNPDFGCANASNFAAMVGDPHHLTEGASNIYQDGERAATNVANYRADKVKSLPPENESFSVIK